MKPNQLLNILGVSLIVIPTLLLFAFGGGVAGDGKDGDTYWIVFQERALEEQKESGQITDGQSLTMTFVISDANISSMQLLVKGVDTYRFASMSPVVVGVSMAGPEAFPGGEFNKILPGESLSIKLGDLCAIPRSYDETLSPGVDPDILLERSPDANMTFTGEWTVIITVERDYFSPFHPLVGSVNVEVALKPFAYSALVQVDDPSAGE